MRLFGLFAGLACLGVTAVVACSSSDDAASPTPEAGADAPIAPPPVDAGVDTGGPGSALQHSGTRLKLQGIQTAEGTFVRGVPFDTKLDSVCFPLQAEDGSIRCVPTATAGANDFSNDTCTSRLASYPKAACGAPKYGAQGLETVPCESRTALYRLGAATTPAMIYQKNGVNCTGSVPDPGYTYYPVTGSVAVSELVALKSVEVPIAPAIRAAVFDGDDGSRIQRGGEFIDVARGKACHVRNGGDDKQRCVPKSKSNSQGGYADVSCTGRVAEAPYCTTPYEIYDDSTANVFESTTCKPIKFRAFPLGAKRAGRDEYAKSADGGCAGPILASVDVYDLGPEIAPATFPEIAFGTFGGPRLVEQTFTSAGVAIFHTGELTDTKLGSSCFFSTGSDGKEHCFPTEIGAFYFADDQCKTPLGSVSSPCSVGPVKNIVVQEGAGCARITRVYAPGAQRDPATTDAYQLINTTCTLIAAGSSSVTAYYALGAEIPASTFAEGKPTKQ